KLPLFCTSSGIFAGWRRASIEMDRYRNPSLPLHRRLNAFARHEVVLPDRMYGVVLALHSWLRWVALLLGCAATINAFRDPLQPSERPPGARWDTYFMLAVDLQVLFGLFLYFGLSPFTKAAMVDFAGALHNPALRFWGVEHIGVM